MGQPQRTGHTVDVVSHQANRLAEGATAVCLAAMTLLVGVQIAGRFLFNYSIFWSDELTRFLLIWVAFLGMSAGVRRGAHPDIDAVTVAAVGAFQIAVIQRKYQVGVAGMRRTFRPIDDDFG